MFECVGFHEARLHLRSMKPMSVYEVSAELYPMMQKIRSLEIFSEFCDESQKPKPGTVDRLLNKIVDRTLELLANIAPIEEAYFNIDLEANTPIFPVNIGYPCFGWDDYYDNCRRLDEGDGEFDQDWQLWFMFQLMDKGDQRLFEVASEKFDWGVSWIEIPDNSVFTWTRLWDKLKEYSLEDFQDSIRIVFYDTGNPYFDYVPETEFYDEGFEFSVDGISELKSYFEEAQKLLETHTKAIERFIAHAEVRKNLVKAYQDAFEIQIRVRV